MLDHFDELIAASAQAISSIRFDKVVVWDGANGQGGGETATANWLRNMAKTLPPMLEVMREIGGVEFPEVVAKLAGVDAQDAPRSQESAPKAASDTDETTPTDLETSA